MSFASRISGSLKVYVPRPKTTAMGEDGDPRNTLAQSCSGETTKVGRRLVTLQAVTSVGSGIVAKSGIVGLEVGATVGPVGYVPLMLVCKIPSPFGHCWHGFSEPGSA